MRNCWRPEPCRRCDQRSQYEYDRNMVEVLLVALFNGGAIDDEVVVDPTMPKAKNNPAQQGSGMAHNLDIARAWERADLSRNARIGIRLCYGEGYTHGAAASVAEIPRSTMSETIARAVGVITATINGKAYKEQEDTEDE